MIEGSLRFCEGEDRSIQYGRERNFLLHKEVAQILLVNLGTYIDSSKQDKR